jgi:hypothetical protein
MGTRIVMLLIVAALARLSFAERYALLVGNTEAQGTYAQLKYVQNDIASFKEILGGFCGFDRSRIVTLYNGTPEDLTRSLAAVAAQLAGSKDDLFLFYYSGHAEATCLKMGAREYPLDSLKQQLNTFPADIRIGIFDACQSGSFARLKGGRLAEPFLFRDDGRAKGQVILCSSSINENAQESDALGSSVFTFHFVNALRGSADMSGDGRVTISEAYQYAYNRTISSTAGSAGGVQHPSYQFRIQGEGDIILADLNVSSRGILLGPDVRGDITIISSGNAVVADLSKEKSSAVMIALSPGSYRVLCGLTEKRYQATALVRENAIARLRQADFSAVATEEGRSKGAHDAALQLGICIGGGYGQYDFSSLSGSLGRRFAEYGEFSMQPGFPLPSEFRQMHIAGEMIALEHFIGTLGCSWFSASRQVQFSGSRSNASGDGSYGTALLVNDTLMVSVIDLGIGYRFSYRYLKNGSIHAGLLFHRATTAVSSVFSDSLYDIRTTGTGANTAVLAVPYIGLGYSYPLTQWLDIGTRLRYRHQKSSCEGDDLDDPAPTASEQSATPLNYRFNGVDGYLYLDVHFTLGMLEKFL